jgi:hypothetical protein
MIDHVAAMTRFADTHDHRRAAYPTLLPAITDRRTRRRILDGTPTLRDGFVERLRLRGRLRAARAE